MGVSCPAQWNRRSWHSRADCFDGGLVEVTAKGGGGGTVAPISNHVNKILPTCRKHSLSGCFGENSLGEQQRQVEVLGAEHTHKRLRFVGMFDNARSPSAILN